MITEEEKQEISKKVSFDFEKLKNFISENEDFIKHDATTGIFSLGVLVHLVFRMQQANLNSTPFEKKLKGLRITAKDVERICTEAIEKVNQYSNQNTYRELREYTLLKIKTNKREIEKMSTQEISFNFVCGLELGRRFKS